MTAIPSYQDLMLPVLKLTADGYTSVPAMTGPLKASLGISDEEAEELRPSGKQTFLANRLYWARYYIYRAGLLEQLRRGHYKVSDRGLGLLRSEPDRIATDDLKVYPEFQEFLSKSKSDGVSNRDENEVETVIDTFETPEVRIESAHALLTERLVDELRALLLEVSPARFEDLIVDLLVAMGYGGGDAAMGRSLGKSGDGGIDGIVNEDALGLDAVYIQAKRYALDAVVGEPAIRDFIGALTSVSATKGVFVTTSAFSRPARDIVERIQQRIVLIDGDRLARLMIEHEVGVRARKSYVIRTVDEDFFVGTGL